MTSSPAQPEQINWNMLFCILFFWYCAVVKTVRKGYFWSEHFWTSSLVWPILYFCTLCLCCYVDRARKARAWCSFSTSLHLPQGIQTNRWGIRRKVRFCRGKWVESGRMWQEFYVHFSTLQVILGIVTPGITCIGTDNENKHQKSK